MSCYRISSQYTECSNSKTALYCLKIVWIFFSKHQHHASEIAQCLLHHTVIKLSPYLNQSASHWLAFRNTRLSKCLSVSFVLLCDMISFAELNSLSTAALAGNGALSFMNNLFSSGQATMMYLEMLSADTGPAHCVETVHHWMCTTANVRYYL